jgi:hypothetical protein
MYAVRCVRAVSCALALECDVWVQVAAQEAVVDSLAVTYLPASPIPGVPTGFNKMTGVAYSSIIELGFVGPQLRMAVSLLQAGLAQGSRVQGNASLVAQAVAMLDAWVNTTGPGFGHAVWDMQVRGFAAQATCCGTVAACCCVLLRVA